MKMLMWLRHGIYSRRIVHHDELGFGIRRRILFMDSYMDLIHQSHWWSCRSKFFKDCWVSDYQSAKMFYSNKNLVQIHTVKTDADAAEIMLRKTHQ